MIIKCHVYNLNKMGVIAGIGPDLSQSPIMIMIPRFQHHLNLERFHQIQVGDQISVEIVDKKFDLVTHVLRSWHC